MSADLKLQLFFIGFLCFSLLGLFTILARTLAGLEFAMGRIEELAVRELRLAKQQLEQKKEAADIASKGTDRHSRADMLLNIPFMERLHKEKPKGS